MTQITLKLTPKEWDLLRSLASDQLFRREFIDPRLPGHRANPGEISMAKQLIERLRKITEGVNPDRTIPERATPERSKASPAAARNGTTA